jgi:hypothetical protein
LEFLLALVETVVGSDEFLDLALEGFNVFVELLLRLLEFLAGFS